MRNTESHDIVIVGGGISGLATALALHRKGLNSIVLEKSDTLRADGLAVGIHTNGWRVLDQLGVGPELRRKATCLSGIRYVKLPSGIKQDTLCGNEEFRCLKRSDLIEALANGLPSGSIHFGCQIVAIEEDSATSFPTVHIHNGSVIYAKDQDPELLKVAMEKMLKPFPEDVVTMVRNSDPRSLVVSHLQYRSPWAMLTGKFWKGTMTVAGDSMHVMGPFIGQRGSSGMEDAVVLARNLASAIQMDREGKDDDQQLKKSVQSALDRYVKERKWRVMRLSTQTYLMGLLLQTPSKMVMLVASFLLYLFFGGSDYFSHARYDCGHL